MPPTRKKEVRSSSNGQLPSMPVLTDDTEVIPEEVKVEEKHEKVVEEEVKRSPSPSREILTSCCKSSNLRLAYSSAMSKPVCLCIIWVHLQASVSADQPIDTRLHRCMVKKRPKPASEGHQIVCHRCVIGFSSYNLYLDHLRSSPCGIQQQAANKPRGLNEQTWNSQQDKQSSMSSTMTTSSSASSQRSSDLIRLANLTHGQSCKNWNTHTPDSSTTSSNRKRKLNLQESSYTKFQQNRIPSSTPWVVSGPRYTAAQRYDWPFQMMQPFNQQPPGVFCHPSFHLPHPSMNQCSISNPFEYNPSGFAYGGYGHSLPPMRVPRPQFGFQQVPQTFAVWQNCANGAVTNCELPNRGDLDLYCNWGWSRSGSQDVFKMSFDREWSERWNQQFSHDQHRPNFSPGYSMNGPFQEFPQQEIEVSGFNHQPSNEPKSNFILEPSDFQKNEFNVTVQQDDLNLLNFGDENLFPLDYDLSLATIEISDVSENDLFGSSGENNVDGMNALDSLMFGDEISSDGSSTNTLQEDLIQQAVNVCGVDDIFQLTPDATDISPEIQNHERDFPDDDINFSKIETGCALNRTPSIMPKKCLKEGSKDPVLTSTANISLAPTLKPFKRYGKSVTVRSDSKAPDPSECPHLSVLRLPPIGANEQAKDQLQLICLQAKLGYVLLGLVGEARLKSYGYPILSVVKILQRILTTCTTVQFLDEKSCCNNHCQALDKSLDQEQLAYRFVKLRVQLLRSNILKLLHLCVPSRQKWQEFGWNNKSVDDIMEELTQQDIPKYRLGDPVLSAISKKFSKKFL